MLRRLLNYKIVPKDLEKGFFKDEYVDMQDRNCDTTIDIEAYIINSDTQFHTPVSEDDSDYFLGLLIRPQSLRVTVYGSTCVVHSYYRMMTSKFMKEAISSCHSGQVKETNRRLLDML